MYKVIKMFTDLQDNNYKYEIGDEYPRLGMKPSLARITELLGNENKQRTALIKEINEFTDKDDLKKDKLLKSTKKSKKNKR
jgi:hypothetical protein